MISRTELNRIARDRFRDAQSLFDAGRYDAAVYLCGYAIEVKLKSRIRRTLHWPSFPSTRAEFQNLTSFKTHDLEVLLQLSGCTERILRTRSTEWSEVAAWDPEMRYNATGTVSEMQARQMLAATRTLLRTI